MIKKVNKKELCKKVWKTILNLKKSSYKIPNVKKFLIFGWGMIFKYRPFYTQEILKVFVSRFFKLRYYLEFLYLSALNF